MNSSETEKKRTPMLEDQITPSNLESLWKSWNINRDNHNLFVIFTLSIIKAIITLVILPILLHL